MTTHLFFFAYEIIDSAVWFFLPDRLFPLLVGAVFICRDLLFSLFSLPLAINVTSPVAVADA